MSRADQVARLVTATAAVVCAISLAVIAKTQMGEVHPVSSSSFVYHDKLRDELRLCMVTQNREAPLRCLTQGVPKAGPRFGGGG